VFIEQHSNRFPVDSMCRVLQVSRSGFYAWRHRGPSPRTVENRALLDEIQRIHLETNEAYGAVKTWRELRSRGFACGRHRVAKLRHDAHIEARRKRRFRITTQSRQGQLVFPNLIEQCFTVARPNRVWVGDITFIPTQEGWLYLAILLDLFGRRVVGWSMRHLLDTKLVLDALDMALRARRPKPGLIHHTDQGRHYVIGTYMQLMKAHGIRPSMSAKGNCYDNACAETFFSSLKNELVHFQNFNTREEARAAIFKYIEIFYNRQRLHQTLGYVSPVEFERRAGVS
jgi:transposase InsO family protein